jgi:methylenetetrahydrofolate reductase (NADPH)
MKVIEHLAQAKDTLVSFEVLPPLKGRTISYIYDHLDPLMEFKPSWINVTYHRSETLVRKNTAGVEEKVDVRKRPGTVGICAAIMNHYNVDAVPHIICGGFSKRETEDALIDLQFLGIDNILVLRGDAEKGQKTFVPETDGNKQAIDLLKQVVGLNNGEYLDKEIINGSKTNFCIGVSGYPEKHFEAPSMEFDLQRAKDKVDAGAQYIMTQMFFDNKKYFEYVDACRSMGINVPIIPGLKPITNKKQMTILPDIFFVDIPADLRNAMLAVNTDEACEQVGTEWLIQQSKELKAAGVPVLHYYTLGKPQVIKNVCKNVF